ncbi:hypothetical protein PM082_016585 [Marasmius tenuissimus]|nr:hypothetical protein PM082_016585 [Marasmius tenuissimus]
MTFIEPARLCLVVLTGYVVSLSFAPPTGSIKLPPRPTTESPWSAWTEYLLVRCFSTRLTPVQRMTYIILTVFESTYILSSMIQGSSISTQPNLNDRPAGLTLIPAPTPLRPRPLAIMGLLITISGCLLRIACYRALGASFTFESTAPKGLVTTGPYAIVRHPSYLGWWLTLVSLPWYHLSRGSWVIESGFLDWQVAAMRIGKMIVYGWVLVGFLTAVLLTMRARYEDKSLKEQFPREWEAWSKRVRYLVIPGVY